MSSILFSGVDLASVCAVNDLNDFWSSSDVRGDLPVYSGVPGAAGMRRPLASKLCSGQGTIVAATAVAAEESVAAAKAVLRAGQVQTVTRRKWSASTGVLDATQSAIVRTVSERWISANVCTLLIGVELLDGAWIGASEAIAAVGAVTVKGDIPTRAITATLSAGAVDPIVANTDNGYSFRYVGTVPAGGVLIDVAARTATGITGSVPLSANLRWAKSDPFQLDPGGQTLTTTAGTVSFTYLPAYL